MSPEPLKVRDATVASASLFVWVYFGWEIVMGRKLLVTLMFLGMAQMGMGGVITFDALSDGPLPADYFENADDPSILWANFLVTGPAGAKYVQNGASLATFQAGSTFDFLRADFMLAAGAAPDAIVVSGARDDGGNMVVFSSVLEGLGTTSFEDRILNLRNLYWLTFTPDGGGTFYMDNVAVYNGGQAPVIPVPGAIVLGGIGTLCVGWLRRRRAL